MPFRLFRRKPRVRFVYLRRSRRTGSTVMRCFQLCDLVRRHLGSHFDFGVVELPRFRDASAGMRWVNSQPSGATYIFVKKAIRAGRISGATSLLLHHADPRLAALSHRHQHLPRMQAVYFGSLDNGFLPPDIARRLTVLQATNNAAFKASVRRLVDFNLHYCVRGRQPRAAKPFTKGFTAAACSCPVSWPHAEGLVAAVHPVGGPNVFAGYEADPEANAQVFRDGWFLTGDVGHVDADGDLFLAGRVKELINRGGFSAP